VPSRMAPPFYDHAGRTLDGRYELIARVGAGAFATVYRARDRNVHGRVVAVKVLHPERASDQATVQRFLREVKLAARITGKHRDRLVQILDQGYCEAEAPGLLYFVMEFAFGPTLQGLLRQASGGTFLWPRAVALGHEVAQALVTLHGHGVIHRDIKPSNCILEEDRVRLLDLGIAKLLPDHEGSDVVRLTLPNMVVGTLRYMAPEQQSGHACDARADLYAVGVMLYEFLTGGGPVLPRADRTTPP
jgi:serine/threonine protein kinase